MTAEEKISTYWETMVPEAGVKLIKERRVFGYRPPMKDDSRLGH